MIRVARSRRLSKADCRRLDDRAWALGATLLTLTSEERDRRSAICSLILRIEIELGNCAPVR